jgi:hypothetical protein
VARNRLRIGADVPFTSTRTFSRCDLGTWLDGDGWSSASANVQAAGAAPSSLPIPQVRPRRRGTAVPDFQSKGSLLYIGGGPANNGLRNSVPYPQITPHPPSAIGRSQAHPWPRLKIQPGRTPPRGGWRHADGRAAPAFIPALLPTRGVNAPGRRRSSTPDVASKKAALAFDCGAASLRMRWDD